MLIKLRAMLQCTRREPSQSFQALIRSSPIGSRGDVEIELNCERKLP